MLIRKITAVCGVIVAAAAAGLIGQSLVAQAGAPATSDKTLYAGTNPAFTYNVTTSTNTAKTLLAVTVHAPSAGQVALSIDSQVWTNFPGTTSGELENVLTIARCGAANTLATKCSASTTVWFHKPQNSTANDSTEPYSIIGLMAFSKAGKHTLYLNGSANAYPAGLWGDDTAHVQVAFTPSHPISTGAHVTVSAKTPGSV